MNKVIFFIKYYFSYLIYSFFYAKYKNNIWLIGERFGESANDNGYLFFKYMVSEKKSENVYFIYNNKDLLEHEFLKGNDKVVKLNSMKHFLLYFRTEYVIVSHGVRDAIPTGVFSFYKNKIKPVIYLQHGVIKFKKIFYSKESYNKSILRFITSTEEEKEIVCNRMMSKKVEHDINFCKYKLRAHELYLMDFKDEVYKYIDNFNVKAGLQERLNVLTNKIGFNKSRVPICGLPRFDFMKEKSSLTETEENIILIFPTWRDGFNNLTNDEFLKTSYFKNYNHLLSDKKLLALLEKNGFIIKFKLHSEMRKFKHLFESLSSDNIVISENDDVQSLILESRFLITDYSSLSWDFKLLGKKVIFYHFDVSDYREKRSDYCKSESDWFGDILLDSKSLVEHIGETILNESYNVEPLDVPDNCCELIYEEIENIPKKVVFLVYNIYGVGGTVRTIINNANYLYSKGYDVEIISVKRTSLEPRLGLDAGIKVNVIFDGRNNGIKYKKLNVSLKANILNLIVRVLSRFKSLIINKNEDLYRQFTLYTDIKLMKELRVLNNCHLITTIPSFNILAPKIVRNHVSVIGQEHKSFFAHNSALRDKIMKNYNKLDSLTVLTNDDFLNYKKFLSEDKITILPNATNIPESVSFIRGNNKKIVSLSRFVKEKRIDLLVEAFEKVLEHDSECILNIYGDGPLKQEIIQMVKDKGLDRNIIINDSVSDIESVLSENAIFALSSESEGFGMVIIEANANGLPVVSFDIPNGPNVLIKNNVTGLKAKAFDVDDFASCILRLVNNDTLRVRLAESAYLMVKNEYSLSAVGKRLENVLKY